VRERRPRETRKAAAAAGVAPPAAQSLFDALRTKRLALAKAQGVPPYVIFHDSTLLAMAETKPQDLEALARLPGIGEAKLRRYGAAFLGVIAGFAEAG
jgi:ATP-dependent DNA helicase RecQ